MAKRWPADRKYLKRGTNRRQNPDHFYPLFLSERKELRKSDHKKAPFRVGGTETGRGVEGNRFRGSGVEIEAIQFHHLGPGRDEVLNKLLLSVSDGIDLRETAQMGVRPENKID